MFARSNAKALLTLLFVVMGAFLMGSHATELGPDAVFLRLRADGALIQADPIITSLGREGMIIVDSYTQAGVVPVSATTGIPQGKRVYDPVRIRKSVDRSSPLIQKAWVQQQQIDAEFQFFRPNPSGDGTTQMYNKVTLGNARISAVRTAYSETGQLLEEVDFVFQTIAWEHTVGGIVFQDSIL